MSTSSPVQPLGEISPSPWWSRPSRARGSNGTSPSGRDPEKDLTSGIGLIDLLRATAGLLLIVWAYMVWTGAFIVPGAVPVTVTYSVIGVIVTALAIAPLSYRQHRFLDTVTLFLTLVAFTFWVHAQVYISPAYGTDEIAFGQGAAQQLLHGINPYTTDLGWALDHFQVPASYHTYRLNGTEVTTMTYPALSFLIYVPALLVGVDAQAAVYVDSLFWAAAMVVLWLCLPWRVRPIVPILASLTVYLSFVVGGVSDAVYLPFVVLAFYRWDRFSEKGAGLARWMGPVALGLACGMKQSPWFLVPFLVIAVGLEGRAAGERIWRRPLQYTSLWAVSFLLPNLPFLILSPHAWFRGVLAPLADPLVPFGQAFVALTVYLNRGGGHLGYYTFAALSVVAALALALVRWYPLCKRLVPLFPAIILLFPTRSLTNYFIYALPVLLVCVSTVRVAPRVVWLRRHGRLSRACAVAAVSLGMVACGWIVAAAAATPPLSLTVIGAHSTGQLGSFDQLQLRVLNRADRPLSPHFTVSNGLYMSTPWLVERGPLTLAPHREDVYEISAPNVPSMPSMTVGFEVYATTADPATISASAPVEPSVDHTEITPQAVNRIIGKGEAVELDVRVLDRLGREVHQAGIPVALGQVVYAQEGSFAGELSINDHPEGQTPISVLTDAQGVAHFEVHAVQTQPYELFAQAWLPTGYPKGYSNTVGLRFRYP